MAHDSRHPLPWPIVGWIIKMSHGTDAMPAMINYTLCHVLRPLNMKIEVYKTCMHMIFSDLRRLNIPPTVKPSKIIPCDVSDYIKMLKSSCTVSAIYKVLITSR